VTDTFRTLRRRRLVIVGGPGAGKTTLAVQLLLQLLASLQDDEPIPVLFSVAGWDTDVFPRLHDWLAQRLAEVYPALRASNRVPFDTLRPGIQQHVGVRQKPTRRSELIEIAADSAGDEHSALGEELRVRTRRHSGKVRRHGVLGEIPLQVGSVRDLPER
jgi:GTPase SAR1 family protein